MDVLPSQSEVFLLSVPERNLVPAGPAIIDAEGNRYDVPPKVVEALSCAYRRCGQRKSDQVSV